MNTVPDFILPLAGGLLIGTSALLMLLVLGRITGISGIYAALFGKEPGGAWRWAFVAGLLAGPLLYHWLSASPAPLPSDAPAVLTVLAGLLVGFGTRYAGGCTSGHGVCGIGRLSPRSMAATAAFIGAGMLTVFLVRLLTSG